jgi:hypothetical protein
MKLEKKIIKSLITIFFKITKQFKKEGRGCSLKLK